MSVLNLILVSALPTPQAGFIDCGDVGCEINAIRLNALCDMQLYLNCLACQHLLMHDSRWGWSLKLNSREDIARQREEARERYAPQIGAGWKALQKMRKVA